MLSKHNNAATLWLAPEFREFDAYEATTGFHKASYSHIFIYEEVHVIEDDEIPYCKPNNPWKGKPLRTHASLN